MVLNKHVIKFSAAFVLILMVMAASFVASEPACAGQDGVPLPSLAKAVKGEQCVEPADVMRRNHMNFLTHQRDETVRDGIRGKKYSLRQCTECHATADPEIANGEVRTLQPFCGECHAYAAVEPDCFSCHNPTLPLLKNSALPIGHENDTALAQWKIAAHLSEGIGVRKKENAQ